MCACTRVSRRYMHIRYWSCPRFRRIERDRSDRSARCYSFRERKYMINTKGSARKWLIGGLAAVTTTAGLVVGVAGPASADPVTTLVGVGSDTTQDVLDAVANQIGGGVVGSWDAV